jgi:hypothetical protein
MHELLLLCPAHVVNFRRVVHPFRRTILDAQSVREQARGNAKRQNYNGIQNGEKYARLEIANLVGQAFPCIPKSLYFAYEGIRHESLNLEQRVDEGSQSRALGQDDKNRKKKHGKNQRQHPAALVTRKKGYEFSRNSDPPIGCLDKSHQFSSFEKRIVLGEPILAQELARPLRIAVSITDSRQF